MPNPNRRRPPGRPRVKLTPEEARESRLENNRHHTAAYRARPENKERLRAYRKEYQERKQAGKRNNCQMGNPVDNATSPEEARQYSVSGG